MKLSQSQAHYIKAVYELSDGSGGVRVMDIANRLSLTKASVSLAMTKLQQQGLVRKNAERQVYLTDDGEREAVKMMDKFEVIRRFLTGVLGVSSEAAEFDACAMEHVISMDTLCALCRHTDKEDTPSQCNTFCGKLSK